MGPCTLPRTDACNTDASGAIARSSDRALAHEYLQRPHAMASHIVKPPRSQHNGPSLSKAAQPFLDALAVLIARAILEAEKEQDENDESRDLRPEVHRR